MRVSNRQKPRSGRGRHALRPWLDVLEDRRLLSVLTVNTVEDDTGDTSVLTLRDAITLVNHAGDPTSLGQATMPDGWAAQIDVSGGGFGSDDRIAFDIPGTGVHTIQPGAALPAITAPVVIDGYTQPGAAPNTNDPTLGDNAVPLVELDGSQAGPSASGLTLLASDSTIRGLVINCFSNDGIVINGPTAARDVIAGNFIGTDPSGTLALPNGVDPLTTSGIWVQSAANNTIGGPAAADRNLISGNRGCGVTVLINSSGNLVAGNFIGTTAAGDTPLGNGQWGVSFGNYTYYQCCGDHNTIGGNAAGMRNLISGNPAGIALFHETDDLIAGNFMGTDPTGMRPVQQGWAIWLNACQGVTVGGTTPEARNLIACGGMDISDGTGDSVVQGNDFGTDVTGQNALGQCLHAIMLERGARHITIGGNVAGAKNVLTGSTSWAISSEASCHDIVIAGNFIGTNAAGTAALPTRGGVMIWTNPNSAGGSDEYNIRVGTDGDGVGDDLERNVISGTVEAGVAISGGAGNYVRNVLVAGNYIGLGADGKTVISNGTGVGIGPLVSGVVIGGATPAMRNVISGNVLIGVDIGNTTAGSAVLGNYIGTSADGTTLIPNGVGVRLMNTSDNTIGGSSLDGTGNLISDGIWVLAGSSRNLFAGNTIGPLGADDGYNPVRLFGVYEKDSSFNTIGGVTPGSGNLIDGLPGNGVAIIGQSVGNQIRGNAIYENGGLGIDLGNDGVTLNGSHAAGEQGPNNWQVFPVLSTCQGGASTTVTGTLAGTVGASYTLDFYANVTPDPSGYGQGQVYLGSQTVTVTDPSGNVTFTATGLAATSPGQWIIATATGPDGSTSEFSQDLQVPQASPTGTVLTSSANPSLFGQPVMFTVTVTTPATGLGSPTGTVQFIVDGSNFGDPVTLSGGTAAISTSALSVGPHTTQAIYGGDSNFLPSTSPVLNQMVLKATPLINWSDPADIIYGTVLSASQLDATASVPGTFQYTPGPATLLEAGLSQSLTVTFFPADTTDFNNATTTVQINILQAQPTFSNLSAPTIPYGAATTTLTGHLGAGTLAATGNVSITLSGVTQTAAIDASGDFFSTFNTAMLPASASPYTITFAFAGAQNFAPAAATASLMVLSAQAQIANMTTSVNALVSSGVLISGNGNALTVKLTSATASLNRGNTTTGVNQLNAFINQVNTFNPPGKPLPAWAQALVDAAAQAIASTSGSGAHLMSQDSSGDASTGDAQPVSWAGELLTGTVGVALQNADGSAVPPDEEARFQDALNELDSTFGGYGVNLVEVDPASAVIQVETASTSAAGSAADGVLACTFAGQITLVTGWDWYTSADPAQIGPGQYDFQTIVTHELGHAVGLGHSGDTNSVMYAYLAPGQTRRALTAQDLSVLDSHGDALPEPLTAAWRDRRATAPRAISTAPTGMAGSVGNNPVVAAPLAKRLVSAPSAPTAQQRAVDALLGGGLGALVPQARSLKARTARGERLLGLFDSMD
jgi:hypothetical protein